jgi:hypothetical protein
LIPNAEQFGRIRAEDEDGGDQGYSHGQAA